MQCSCPDYAGMCKHVAATMYGVGNRLDTSPELLFVLRGVDHRELIEQAIPAAPVGTDARTPALAADDLGAVFGIELGDTSAPNEVADTPKPPAAKKAPRKTTNPTKKASTAKKPKAKRPPRKG